jgi:hypothetical protein
MDIGHEHLARPVKSVVAAKQKVEIVGTLFRKYSICGAKVAPDSAKPANQVGVTMQLVNLPVSSSPILLLDSVHEAWGS